MAYTATFDEADVAPVVIDNALKVGVGIGTFATVIGLVLGLAIAAMVWRRLTRR